jgi:two-component system chemotaxis response regulator CheB
LIVDPSGVVRRLLVHALGKIAGVKVVGQAADPFEARDQILLHEPDVMTLELATPKMDGETFLRHLAHQKPVPTVVIGESSRRDAAQEQRLRGLGVVEFVAKPDLGQGQSYLQLLAPLSAALQRAARGRAPSPAAPAPSPAVPAPSPAVSAPVAPPHRVFQRAAVKVRAIVVGASTGGTEALLQILGELPRQVPGIVVVQHMPGWAVKSFAQNLHRTTSLDVEVARTGQPIRPGAVIVAPGDQHARVCPKEDHPFVQLTGGERVSGHMPSVDVLMRSAAESLGAEAMGILLTGMGSDGAAGMLALRRAGACTIAQDEASSVVYGMPQEALRLGGVRHVLPLRNIAGFVLNQLQR